MGMPMTIGTGLFQLLQVRCFFRGRLSGREYYTDAKIRNGTYVRTYVCTYVRMYVTQKYRI